ncbi:MAG: hypothetical protein Ct9H90mP16_04330 [Candidatus Poseidoniales archaeon]|nr:MAG: hypothetical protein Ct9H90mP16_04330 [Candidatus Poseidoniales archaeon]
MRIDDFILFAVEVVDEYTVSLDCDDPLPNAYVVIPADPNPPSLYCHLTNNGYREVNLNLFTEVSNTSWMNIFPLRIDRTNVGSRQLRVIEPFGMEKPRLHFGSI